MPPIKAAIDNTTFAKIFTINETYWWFSIKLVESSARKDIVVNDPQNPIAVKREYTTYFRTTKNLWKTCQH